jgi:hypothetical protein
MPGCCLCAKVSLVALRRPPLPLHVKVLRLARSVLIAALLAVSGLVAYRSVAHQEKPAEVLRRLVSPANDPAPSDAQTPRASVARPSASPEVRVLFLGNSLVYTGEMPRTLERLAWSAGVNLTSVEHAPGGWRLSQHATAPAVDAHLSAGGWSAVVLQEQSSLPAVSERQVAEQVLPPARVLASRALAASPGARIFVYETFAHQRGDSALAAHVGPEVATYAGMQERINATYERMAAEIGATIAPVGHAWARVRQAQPDRVLYADPVHPNAVGAYLVACVFYASLTGQSPAGNPYHGTLDAETAEYLQEIAARTVLRSTWARGR